MTRLSFALLLLALFAASPPELRAQDEPEPEAAAVEEAGDAAETPDEEGDDEKKDGDEEEEEEKPKAKLNSSTFSALSFRSIGPAMASGRVGDFAVDPENRSRYFAAVSSGGVWWTENAGTTWKPVFDKYGSYSIGCVEIDPNDPNVVWVGTGENNSQRSVSFGDGVYKSVDGGMSWKNVGLKASEHVGMIAIDPRDSDVVYVAAQGPLWNAGGDRGLYKTTDGGKTWEKILDVDEHTGANEVHLDPRDPDVVYCSTYQRRRRVWTLINGGPGSAIHKSTDGGATWSKITKGLPGGDLGRIGMDLSPADPDVIYAIVEAAEGKVGIYRSTNRGASWSKSSSYMASSPQYYNELVCDPRDVDTLYSLDTLLKVSKDGGASWRNVPSTNRHVDHHALWLDPHDPTFLLTGTDGGIYDSHDGGKNWAFKSNLPITQYYRVSVDDQKPFYYVYGGTQDNNSHGGPSQTTSRAGIANEDWFVTVGGDGYETVADPVDPNILYSLWQYGGLVRHDRRSGEVFDIKPRERPGDAPYRWNWDSPLIISPHLHTRIYIGAQHLFRSDDRGESWEVVSPDLTRQIDRNTLEVMGKVWPETAVSKNRSTSFYGNIVSLSESPLVEGLLYVGTDDGLIQVTEDGGGTWRKVETFPEVPDRPYVSRLEASLHSKDRVYAAFSAMKDGDFAPYVLRSDDRGRTWTSIVGDLPDRNIVWSLMEDHVKEDLLFAGTEFGCFVTLDGGEKWHKLAAGIPNVAVRDMDLQRRENDVVVGTFGRSFYVLDDYSPLRHLTE
ncbi:MAG: WD40/YVTN/BNR-like repeat-containing protein, partial [Planctomycetota bacterium JB042]